LACVVQQPLRNVLPDRVHTVKFHLASILDKLDAAGRAEAVARAARLGLVML